MANVNAPSGLTPVGTLGSGGYTGRIRKFTAVAGDSAAIGIGDPVKLSASSANADGLATVSRATAGDVVVGVMVGVVPVYTDLTLTYRKASTAMQVLVDTDPNTIYSIQADSGGADLAVASIGLNASLLMGSVDTTTGVSGAMLDSSTAAVTNSLDLAILEIDPAVNNTGGAAYQKVLVKLNLHQYANGATGIS